MSTYMYLHKEDNEVSVVGFEISNKVLISLEYLIGDIMSV